MTCGTRARVSSKWAELHQVQHSPESVKAAELLPSVRATRAGRSGGGSEALMTCDVISPFHQMHDVAPSSAAPATRMMRQVQPKSAATRADAATVR
jgi:hypothetical protein